MLLFPYFLFIFLFIEHLSFYESKQNNARKLAPFSCVSIGQSEPPAFIATADCTFLRLNFRRNRAGSKNAPWGLPVHPTAFCYLWGTSETIYRLPAKFRLNPPSASTPPTMYWTVNEKRSKEYCTQCQQLQQQQHLLSCVGYLIAVLATT